MRHIWLLALALGACGDDHTDLSGVYMVTSHVGSPTCGADEPVTDGAPYLLFHQTDLFGHDVYSYEGCTDATLAECNGDGGLFPEPIDNGWKERLSFASGGGSDFPCALGYSYGTATLSGNQLSVDVTTYGDEDATLSEDQCSADEAEKRGTDMPCKGHDTILATRIGDAPATD